MQPLQLTFTSEEEQKTNRQLKEQKKFLIHHRFVERWTELFYTVLNANSSWRRAKHTWITSLKSVPSQGIFHTLHQFSFGTVLTPLKRNPWSLNVKDTPDQIITSWHWVVPLTLTRAGWCKHEDAASPCAGFVTVIKPWLWTKYFLVQMTRNVFLMTGLLCNGKVNYTWAVLVDRRETNV